MAHAALARHRSPGRYTFVLAGTGLMGGTATRYGTSYRSYKPPSQTNVNPPEFSYGADPPDLGAVTKYGAFPLGMGLKSQRKSNAALDLQYDYTLGVDASVYPWVKGPDLTTFTPATTDSTNGVTKFLKVGASLYAVTGRYALLRVNDSSWTVAQDFGSGKVSLDAIDFYSNAAGAAYGFVAMGDADNFWYVTGGVWAQHASLKARAFGVVGREFFRAHSTNTLAKVDTDADPLTAGNWSNDNAFTIGDKSSAVVRLPTTAAGVLLAVKTDGVYTLDEAGDDLKLHAFFPDADNGKAVTRHGNHLFVGFTHNGFWRFDETGGGRQQVGPELLTDGSNVVAGVVTQAKGTQFGLYGAFYKPDTGASYLCKFAGVTDAGVPIWHGSLTQNLGSKVTAMEVDTAGADAGHTRLYLGFADGDVGWFPLPCTPHPSDCSSYRFATADGVLRTPTWDGGFGANTKALDAITVSGRNLTSANYVSVRTRTDPSGAWTAMSGNFDSGQREKIEFPSASSATILDTEVTLVNAANTSSPEVTGFGVHHQVQTPYRQVFWIHVLAENNLRCRDGTPLLIGHDRIRNVVETVADTPGSVTLVLPEGDSMQIRVRGVEKTVAFEQPFRRPRSAFALECVQVVTNQVYGTYDRIEALGSYDAMEARTYDQLESL